MTYVPDAPCLPAGRRKSYPHLLVHVVQKLIIILCFGESVN